MARRGVVLLSADGGAGAFVDDFLEEVAPGERRAVRVATARTCVAAVSLPVRRRLLIIDGVPPDCSIGCLVEAVQLADPELPILVVRYGWTGGPVVRGRVCIHPGPLVSSGCAAALLGAMIRSVR
jgi:hypothetical protein